MLLALNLIQMRLVSIEAVGAVGGGRRIVRFALVYARLAELALEAVGHVADAFALVAALLIDVVLAVAVGVVALVAEWQALADLLEDVRVVGGGLGALEVARLGAHRVCYVLEAGAYAALHCVHLRCHLAFCH